MSEILLAPAERIDVLVQASTTSGTYRLLALPYDRGGMMMGGGSSTSSVTLLTLADAGAQAADALPEVVNPGATRLAWTRASCRARASCWA